MERLARGFGLVESVVAVAVAGVLAAVALPTYRSHLLRSQRTEATMTLQQLQLAQERFHERHGAYAEQLSDLGADASGLTRGGRYRLSLTRPDTQTYELVAQAVGTQAADSDCRTVSLRIEGALTFQQPSARCWHS